MKRIFAGSFAGMTAGALLLLLATPGCAPESDLARDSANIRNVGTTDFDAEVLKAASPVVVDFYATWCGPCKRLAPVMEELAGTYKDQVRFVKVDIDRSPELAKQYEIEGVPTVIFFKDGKIANKIVGLVPKGALKEKIDSLAPGKPAA
jgi:thioredoxin 1